MPGKRVLIVDEDIESRRGLREGLSNAGWQVDDAPDGLGALNLIQQARAFGEGYNCIVADTFLPDTDGILFLMTLREQYPQLPLIVSTGYGNDDLQGRVAELSKSVYFTKPIQMEQVIACLNEFDLAATTCEPVPAPPLQLLENKVCAYSFLRIDSGDRVEELYRTLREMEGVISANAVRGEFDLVLRVAVDSTEKLDELVERIRQVEGVKPVACDRIVTPMLSPTVDEFIRHYQTVWAKVNQNYIAGLGTNAYLLIDIDRYQLERIYTSIKLTEGVHRCRVIGGGTRLMTLMSGAVRPGVVRHLLRKLAQMDGILRVREATVINLRG